jgi:hypothetical protein
MKLHATHLIFNIAQYVGAIDPKAYKDNLRPRVRQRSKPVVIFHSRRIEHCQLYGLCDAVTIGEGLGNVDFDDIIVEYGGSKVLHRFQPFHLILSGTLEITYKGEGPC